MRILSLDLIRYGPFTDKLVSFRKDAKLHLVFGPNEAGKSSSLAAIGDLLFGFSKRQEFDFLHEASTLRLGAEIMARDGAELGFRRRRGSRNTLLTGDNDETPLQEDALAPYLGMLGREVFSRAFGLNSETLRQGGAAMLESEGELGTALFAAASGLTGLARIRRTLEEEADAIYTPRPGKERRFYQALDRYQAAVASERQNELKAGDWKLLIGDIAHIERQLATIKEQRAETAAELARLQRVKVLGPIVTAIDALEDELADFGDLPEVAESFVADSLKALEAAEGTGGQERAAEEDHELAAAALEAIELDKPILARADAVIELFSRKGDYLSKLGELPRAARDLEAFNFNLADLAQRLGFDDPDEMVLALPADATLQTGREVIETGTALEQQVEQSEIRLGEELAEVGAREADSFAGSLADPKPFRDQLAALAPDLKQIEDQIYLETSLRTLEQKLQEGASHLVPPVAEIRRLERAVLPKRETIAAHKAAFERLVVEAREETLKLEANAQQRQETEQKLIEIERSGPVAYEETIGLVRTDREITFEDLRHHLLRSGPLMTPAEVAEKLVRYEEEVAEADSIADQAISDARRLSRLADLREKLDDLIEQRPLLESRLDGLLDEQGRAAKAYARLFEGIGVIPGGPDAMVAWLAAVEDLLATRRDIEALEAQIDNLGRVGISIHKALAHLAKAVGVTGAQVLPPLALSRLVTTALDEMTERWQSRLSFEGARQAARMRVGQVEDNLNKARRDHAAWRARFESLLPLLKLHPDTSTASAAAALSVWASVPEASRQRANAAARADELQRDTKAFEKQVGVLARDLAPQLRNLPAQGLIDVLRERAETARAAKARHDDARHRVDAAAVKLDAARGAHDSASAALNALAVMLPEGSDPRAELARLERRSGLRARLAERRNAFVAAAEGVAEDVVREELPTYDRTRAQLDAEDLERRSDALHVENNQLYAQLGQKQAERERLEAGTGAEFAAFERQGAEAEIVTSARQWAVRKIAAAMLGAAIEKHRESQSDPLLVRGGALFRTLTGGGFADLVQDYGEDDQPRLVGVRRSGERVGIGGMSEGTRDQLYLALRLAYIEDYATRTEPVPFIGDDIFQTFDDDRTAAGIKAFAETSGMFQPILFTHHLSVVAIARRALGEDLDYIEL